jgi:FKBP-type peptidyl-prolyl cis-trans isomerase SlyD
MMIEDNKIVQIDYVLRSDLGAILERSGEPPFTYLHGAGHIVPGLESMLAGLSVGDSRVIVVEPAGAYGDRDPQAIFGVPRSAFPEGLELKVGASFTGHDEEGHAVPVTILEIDNDSVLVDANHPLAGERLHYHIKVRGIRDATPEELAAGEPNESPE